MKLNEYIQDALRTESKIDEVKVNSRMLVNALVLFISAGNILDQVKKRAFYKKDYDTDLINSSYLNARDALGGIAGTEFDAEDDVMDIDPRIFHAIIGLATESTEMCEALYDTMLSERDFDIVNLLEENGDINWYQAIMIDALGGDWAEILTTNIKKLRKRFPEKFTSEHAINRDLDSERKVLDELK